MKIKTRYLQNLPLIYACAAAENRRGLHVQTRNNMKTVCFLIGAWDGDDDIPVPAYLGAYGDALIDSLLISTTVDHSGVWLAYHGYNLNNEQRWMHSGATRREAAMRCFVASTLGDEVDVPEELL